MVESNNNYSQIDLNLDSRVAAITSKYEYLLSKLTSSISKEVGGSGQQSFSWRSEGGEDMIKHSFAVPKELEAKVQRIIKANITQLLDNAVTNLPEGSYSLNSGDTSIYNFDANITSKNLKASTRSLVKSVGGQFLENGNTNQFSLPGGLQIGNSLTGSVESAVDSVTNRIINQASERKDRDLREAVAKSRKERHWSSKNTESFMSESEGSNTTSKEPGKGTEKSNLFGSLRSVSTTLKGILALVAKIVSYMDSPMTQAREAEGIALGVSAREQKLFERSEQERGAPSGVVMGAIQDIHGVFGQIQNGGNSQALKDLALLASGVPGGSDVIENAITMGIAGKLSPKEVTFQILEVAKDAFALPEGERGFSLENMYAMLGSLSPNLLKMFTSQTAYESTPANGAFTVRDFWMAPFAAETILSQDDIDTWKMLAQDVATLGTLFGKIFESMKTTLAPSLNGFVVGLSNLMLRVGGFFDPELKASAQMEAARQNKETIKQYEDDIASTNRLVQGSIEGDQATSLKKWGRLNTTTQLGQRIKELNLMQEGATGAPTSVEMNEADKALWVLIDQKLNPESDQYIYDASGKIEHSKIEGLLEILRFLNLGAVDGINPFLYFKDAFTEELNTGTRAKPELQDNVIQFLLSQLSDIAPVLQEISTVNETFEDAEQTKANSFVVSELTNSLRGSALNWLNNLNNDPITAESDIEGRQKREAQRRQYGPRAAPEDFAGAYKKSKVDAAGLKATEYLYPSLFNPSLNLNSIGLPGLQTQGDNITLILQAKDGTKQTIISNNKVISTGEMYGKLADSWNIINS